jgi:hypothetical protein
VNYVIAVIGLSVAFVLLYLAQRWAGSDGEAACDECEQPGCAVRGAEEPAYPTDPQRPDPG